MERLIKQGLQRAKSVDERPQYSELGLKVHAVDALTTVWYATGRVSDHYNYTDLFTVVS